MKQIWWTLAQYGIRVCNPDGSLINKEELISKIVELHASIESDDDAEILLGLADFVDIYYDELTVSLEK